MALGSFWSPSTCRFSPVWPCGPSAQEIPSKSCNRPVRLLDAGCREELLHAVLNALGGQRLLVDLVDARILVLVLDLAAAGLDVDVHAQEGLLLVFREGIAQPAEGDGQVAGRLGADVEVLVEQHVGGC